MPSRKRGKETQKVISTTLSTIEVAAIFGVHPNTIRRWCQEGKISAERTGTKGDRKFRREDVAVYYLDRAIQMFLKGKHS